MRKITMLPTVIAGHIFGEKHTEVHRITIGMILSCCGLFIAYSCQIFNGNLSIIHYIGDFSGMSIHAIGIVPLIEKIQGKKV